MKKEGLEEALEKLGWVVMADNGTSSVMALALPGGESATFRVFHGGSREGLAEDLLVKADTLDSNMEHAESIKDGLLSAWKVAVGF